VKRKQSPPAWAPSATSADAAMVTRHDLTTDPGELHDLAPERPEEALDLDDRLTRLGGPDGDAVPHAGAVPAATGPDEPDAEVRRALESLGYLQ